LIYRISFMLSQLRWRHYIFIALIFLFLLGCGWQTLVSNLSDKTTDFKIYYNAAEAFVMGLNPYRDFRSPYPAIFLVLMAPFTLLPIIPSLVIWFLINVGLLFVSFHLFCKIFFKEQVFSSKLDLFFVFFFLYAGVIQSNLRNSQINLVILTLVMLFLFFFKNQKTHQLAWPCL
jgi:hypothetical protein